MLQKLQQTAAEASSKRCLCWWGGRTLYTQGEGPHPHPARRTSREGFQKRRPAPCLLRGLKCRGKRPLFFTVLEHLSWNALHHQEGVPYQSSLRARVWGPSQCPGLFQTLDPLKHTSLESQPRQAGRELSACGARVALRLFPLAHAHTGGPDQPGLISLLSSHTLLLFLLLPPRR